MSNYPTEQYRRILVIDDNRAIHEDFRKIFAPGDGADELEATAAMMFGQPAQPARQLHYEIDSAYQGQEGFERVQAALAAGRPYAMAFVDIRMPPGWDGVETTRKIWSVDPEIQIVICTAYADYSWEEMLEQIGKRDGLLILKKPFDTVEALQMAQALTEKWWLHRKSRDKMQGLEGLIAGRTRELQQSNDLLQRQQTELRVLFDLMPAMVCFKDTEDRILRVNQQLAEFIGKPVREIEGKPASEVYPPGTAGDPSEDLAVIHSRAPVLGRIEAIQHPQNGEMWIQKDRVPVCDEAGKAVGIVVMALDITARRRAGEVLRESEERFSGAFEHAPIGMALVSPEGRWLKVNRALCDLVGYSETGLLARTFQDITHPEDLAADLEQVRRMIAGEIHTYQMEKRYVHLRGHLVTVSLHVSLIRDGRGQPLYFISHIQDITALKRLETRLLESQKLASRGELAGGIAHEVDSLLTAIIDHCKLLSQELPPGSPPARNATEINAAAGRAALLTRQLLA